MLIGGKYMNEDNIIEETVEFNQELYEKNIKENIFAETDNLDGIGDEE